MPMIDRRRRVYLSRMDAFTYFKGEGFYAKRVPNLSDILYPQFTRTVVKEIASAKAIGFDLVLLSFLPTIAAAERGKHRLILSDGRTNSLSCIFLVGAESGAGKGRALEETLSFFSEKEKVMTQQIQQENKLRTNENHLTKLRISALKRRYKKTFDPEIANQICMEQDNLKEMLPLPHLLLNDITPSAYDQELINHGVAVRLESDGILLPDKTMRIVNKAWSGESNRRTRLFAPDGTSYDPFIVDLVMTQPEFFHRYLSNSETLESGRLARTLTYLYNANTFTSYQPAHGIDPEIRSLFHKKLESLLCYSETTSSEKTTIFVDREAEKLFLYAEGMWHAHCKFDGSLYKIKDFGERMGQHALRLAGILHLAENEVGSQTKITYETMQIAIDMVNIFAEHTFAYRIKGYGDFNRKCCCDIMTYVLGENLYKFSETELKQALKSRNYQSKDIAVGIYYLQQDGHLCQDDEFCSRENRVGRSAGRIFINPYHERYGRRI